MKWRPHPDAEYKYKYADFFYDLKAGKYTQEQELSWYREFILNDLFFIVCFVMQNPNANHPFIVKMCKIVEDGPRTNTLDVWARGHYKSTIITQAETLQYILKNPEHCNVILSYARPLAKKFLRSIKVLCEESLLLKACFPDVLWENPFNEAPKWSEDDGLVFRRKSAGRGESTLEAWGMIEGMPTGRHFERKVFDDVEVSDIAENPEQLEKCFEKFGMAGNLGTNSDTDITRVIGTFYSHFGPIVRIKDLQYENGENIYTTRIYPATKDGTRDGELVFMGEQSFAKAKMMPGFESQQLCDPTPKGNIVLRSADLKRIEHDQIPKDLHRFLLVDQAGDDEENQTKGDDWAIGLFGVRPVLDDIGQSEVYILAGECDKMNHSEAIETVVRMYMDGGIIRVLAVEKVSLSTTEKHIADALKVRGRRVSKDSGNLMDLKPAGRSLRKRIEGAVQWPLCNGKIYYSSNCNKALIDKLKMEMDKFPFFHSNFLNILAYLYDVLKEHQFSGNERRNTIDYSKVFIR